MSFIHEGDRIVIATDASVANSGGIGLKDAWFGVYFGDNSEYNHKGKFKFQVKDSNQAELAAAKEGLKQAQSKSTNKKLKLYTDSEYVLQHKSDLTSQFPQLNIVVQSVPRAHKYIGGADKLAAEASN